MEKRLQTLTPARILVIGFLVLIALGTVLLRIPAATVDGQGLGWIDALFTATSAVCVTGLVVVDTGTHLTLFGQSVVLTLIQAGGLGFMTTATLLALVLGRRIGLRHRILIQESLNQFSLSGVVRLSLWVLLTTAALQSIGAIILFIRFLGEMPWPRALYFSVFHVVSAFANAGFDLLGEFRSFTGYAEDPWVSLVLASLFVLGGLGFTVLLEIATYPRSRQLSLHSKVVLAMTFLLSLLGIGGFALLEWTNPNTLQLLSPQGRLLASIFQGLVPRTAGFSTVNYGLLREPTLFLTIILMFIGASPAGTGGGVKTTTAAILLLAVRAELTGVREIEVYQRRLPAELVHRSLAIVVLGLLLVFVVTLLLLIYEPFSFLEILFECVSAFATVGLSTGITPQLTAVSRLLLAVLMYAGRVGPITLGIALAEKAQPANRRFAEERIVVG